MGLRGISLGSILIILLVVILIFGTKRLRHIGEDLGVAFKGFRKGMREAERDNKDKEDPS